MRMYNVGFETTSDKKVGTVVQAETIDEAVRVGRERLQKLFALRPGSTSQRCDSGPGDKRFHRIYEMHEPDRAAL